MWCFHSATRLRSNRLRELAEAQFGRGWKLLIREKSPENVVNLLDRAHAAGDAQVDRILEITVVRGRTFQGVELHRQNVGRLGSHDSQPCSLRRGIEPNEDPVSFLLPPTRVHRNVLVEPRSRQLELPGGLFGSPRDDPMMAIADDASVHVLGGSPP